MDTTCSVSVQLAVYGRGYDMTEQSVPKIKDPPVYNTTRKLVKEKKKEALKGATLTRKLTQRATRVKYGEVGTEALRLLFLSLPTTITYDLELPRPGVVREHNSEQTPSFAIGLNVKQAYCQPNLHFIPNTILSQEEARIR